MSNGINSPYGLVAVESASGDGATRKMKAYTLPSDSTTGLVGNVAMYSGDVLKLQPSEGVAGSFPAPPYIVTAVNYQAADNAVSHIKGPVLGAFIGCQYRRKDDGRIVEKKYLEANLQLAPGANVTIFVNDDPNTIFRIQMSTSDDNKTKLIDTKAPSIYRHWMIGMNATVGVGGFNFAANSNPDGSTPNNNPLLGTNNRSNLYLDGSSITLDNNNAGNADFSLKIIGLAPSSDELFMGNMINTAGKQVVPGIDAPFCDLLVKFNNHIFSAGVANSFNKVPA